MHESSGVGLRERKRAQTSEAIHTAAIELVLERGLELATIDAISERADVSTRTFFNYFPSKEDALLGIDANAVTAELAMVRDTSGDTMTGVFDLIYAIFEAGGGHHQKDDKLRTREVMHKYPQLMTRQMLRVAELEGQLSEIVAGWLANDPRFAADSDAERLEQARIILGICMATVRVSMKKWASESDSSPGERFDPAAPRKTYERAIATLRTVLEKLA